MTNNLQTMKMEAADLDKYCPRGLDVNSSQYSVGPFNDACLENFFDQLHSSLRRYSEWEEYLYTGIYIVISFLAVIGNGLVILAVVRKKSMQTNRNVLILNLAISNLILAFINIPFLWLPTIDFEFPYSRFFCKFANGFPGSNIYCSTLTICVMAVDRYYSVKRMKAPTNRKQCMSTVIMSLGIWAFSFLLSVPLLVYYDTSMLFVAKDVNVTNHEGIITKKSYGWRQCRLAPSHADQGMFSTQTIQLMTSFLQVIFLYIVPLFVLSIFNMKLTRFLRMNSNAVNRNRTVVKRATRPSDTPIVTTRGSSVFQKMPAPANDSAAARRTSRTTSLLIAMAGCYAALWLPFTLISFLLDLDIFVDESYAAVIERIDQICKIVSMLSICVNPFLYGFLNTNFRHEFREIYCTYIRCMDKNEIQRGRGYDVPSIVVNLRSSSLPLENTDSGFVSIVGKTFRGSMQRIRSSFHNDHSQLLNNGERGDTPKPCDRIVLDGESARDSFL